MLPSSELMQRVFEDNRLQTSCKETKPVELYGGVEFERYDGIKECTCEECIRWFAEKRRREMVQPVKGVQSTVQHSFNLIPPKALLAVAGTLYEGAAKYEPHVLDTFSGQNWRSIPIADHYNHAVRHLVLWHSGDRSEDHISHAICRLSFILELT